MDSPETVVEELWACWPAERLLTVSDPFLDIALKFDTFCVDLSGKIGILLEP